jgi:hypothetical protein
MSRSCLPVTIANSDHNIEAYLDLDLCPVPYLACVCTISSFFAEWQTFEILGAISTYPLNSLTNIKYKQNKTLAARTDTPELIKMTTTFTPVQSQSPRSKFPRRNAITAFMLTKSAALAVSESPHPSQIPFDEDNGKITCPGPLIPVVLDANLNKRPLENYPLESRYDGSCNESDLRFTLADALAESHHQGVSLPKYKKFRVSLREPERFPESFQVEKET